MPPTKRGYRRFFKRPAKGCKPWKVLVQPKSNEATIYSVSGSNDKYNNNLQDIPMPSDDGWEPISQEHILKDADLLPNVICNMTEASDMCQETVSDNYSHFCSGGLPVPLESSIDSIEDDFLGFDVQPTLDTTSTSQVTSGNFGFRDHTHSSVSYPLKLKPIRVLSLFDGISSGLCALNYLHFNVEVYFSSEIEADALAVQKFQHYQKNVPVGCVKSLSRAVLKSLGHIDLLLGASPCGDLSLVNPRRRGLHDADSTGTLFYEFIRVREILEQFSRESGHTLFWMFENTFSMEKDTLAEMTSALHTQPVMICASSFTGMKRKRNYWGNLPLMERPPSGINAIRPNVLQNALMPYRKATVSMLNTITSASHSQLIGPLKAKPVLEDGMGSHLFISELEKLFGLPDHYTDVGNLSVSRRRKLIGKGWCIPVICHLLKPLLFFFEATYTKL